MTIPPYGTRLSWMHYREWTLKLFMYQLVETLYEQYLEQAQKPEFLWAI
jgi:hypothetical protein